MTMKTAIVTGASGGIGRATAKRLALNGYAVAVHFNRDAAGAEQTLEEVNEAGGEGFVFGGDLSEETVASRLIGQTLECYGCLDALVNIAGISPKHPGGRRILIEETEAAQWDEVMDVNMRSMFLVSKHAIPIMKKQRSGKIINMSSIVGRTGLSGTAGAHYAASKGAIITFTKTLATELGAYGIQANVVTPGWIETPLTTQVRDTTDILKAIPLKRFGRADEVAGTIAFLLTPDADYITGATIDINGGWYVN